MHDNFQLTLSIEFDRAVKLRRPLSCLVLLRPDLPGPLPDHMLEQANAVIANGTRSYDAAALVSERVILLLLPECDASGARLVADRLRADFAARNDGRRRWSIMEFPNVQQYGSPQRLLEVARRVGLTAAA